MKNVKKILIIADLGIKPVKLYLDQMPKLGKGFIRLGHDVRYFNYGGVLAAMSPLKSRRFARFFCKSKVDSVLAEMARHYCPDIVYVSFAKYLNKQTLDVIRTVLPHAVLVGGDGDPWPGLQGDRIETAKGLDILLATNDGVFLREYKDAGVKKCVFMPNMCDPDTDRRYEVGSEWKSNLLWTGALFHHTNQDDELREQLIRELEKFPLAKIYGCLNYPKVAGLNYLYAISGTKIGVHINAVNSVRLYHSDRLTHYLSCGAFVLAMHVPDSERLFQDGKHIRYYNTVEEFCELAKWYLAHETERQVIADAGMRYCHDNFNSTQIARYILDLAEKGQYCAPWGTFS